MADPLANVSGTKFLELSAEFLDLKFYLFIHPSAFPTHQVAKFSDSFEFDIANESPCPVGFRSTLLYPFPETLSFRKVAHDLHHFYTIFLNK